MGPSPSGAGVYDYPKYVGGPCVTGNAEDAKSAEGVRTEIRRIPALETSHNSALRYPHWPPPHCGKPQPPAVGGSHIGSWRLPPL